MLEPERPGSRLASRPLHFFILADCSGSMASDGKIAALNNAIREMLPHLLDVAAQNPHAEVLVRAIAFSSGARWHVAEPTPVEAVDWPDLTAGGYTDLGAALDLLAAELGAAESQRCLPSAALLVSDGMPTDDYRSALGRFLDEPAGRRAVRMAVGIGRDADHEVLERFVGSVERAPTTANNPEQLVRMIRWAATEASRAASSLARPQAAGGLFRPEEVSNPSDVVW
jgi:uncharacterized protein YegL